VGAGSLCGGRACLVVAGGRVCGWRAAAVRSTGVRFELVSHGAGGGVCWKVPGYASAASWRGSGSESTQPASHACVRVYTWWLGRELGITQQTLHVCMRAHACVGKGAGWPGGRGGRKGPARGMRAGPRAAPAHACGPHGLGGGIGPRQGRHTTIPSRLGCPSAQTGGGGLPGGTRRRGVGGGGRVTFGRHPPRGRADSRAEQGGGAPCGRAGPCRGENCKGEPIDTDLPCDRGRLSGGPREAPMQAAGLWAGSGGSAAFARRAGPPVAAAAAELVAAVAAAAAPPARLVCTGLA
jgi:hypothetical protein